MSSTLDWLRGRTDPELTALLQARPDLLLPAPSDLSALSRRLDTPASIRRAIEGLDKFGLQALSALLILGAHRHPVAPDAVADFLGAPPTTLNRALDRLQLLGLARGTDVLRTPSAAGDILGPYPGGLGSPAELPPGQVETALARIGPEARAILERLAQGPPVGRIDPRGQLGAAVTALIDSGLLLRLDRTTVELPREVGLALRGPRPLGRVVTDPPPAELTDTGATVVDGTAAGQSLALLARLTHLLSKFGAAGIPALKSTGLGIRELRRLARDLDVDEHIGALHVELLAAAGLIATVASRSARTPPIWAPTEAADAFLAAAEESAWAQIADGWLDLRRDPSRIGRRDDAGRLCNALSPELSWLRGPVDRRTVLDELAALPAGVGATRASLTARLAFRSPLRDPERLAAMVAAVLTEATALGLVAFDAASGAGRAALAGDSAAAVAALAEALPPRVDRVLVQADLTVVAPGRLAPALAAALARAAVVESVGSATVYRVSADSLRRAFDSGSSSAELHALFAAHSSTIVPQALTYLIDDVARRHGVLRAGAASSYLRSEDPALLAEAVAAAAGSGIVLHRLAPSVAVASVDLPELMDCLRAAGLLPAAEDAHGALLDLTPPPRRTSAGPLYQRWREPAPPSADQIAALVQRMREADAARSDSQSAAQLLTVLRAAAQQRAPVWIGYADRGGRTNRRVIEPIVVSGGSVLAYDRLRQAVWNFALHRITAAEPAAEPAADEDHRR